MFLQLLIIVLYIWTFKYVDIFCYMLQTWMGTLFHMENFKK
jgi:hypothetical protein